MECHDYLTLEEVLPEDAFEEMDYFLPGIEGLNSDNVRNEERQASCTSHSIQTIKTRRRYTAATKLAILAYAKSVSVHAASKRYNVSRDNIRHWRKKEKELASVSKTARQLPARKTKNKGNDDALSVRVRDKVEEATLDEDVLFCEEDKPNIKVGVLQPQRPKPVPDGEASIINFNEDRRANGDEATGSYDKHLEVPSVTANPESVEHERLSSTAPVDVGYDENSNDSIYVLSTSCGTPSSIKEADVYNRPAVFKPRLFASEGTSKSDFVWTCDTLAAFMSSVRRKKTWAKSWIINTDSAEARKFWASVAGDLREQFGVDFDANDLRTRWNGILNYKMKSSSEDDPLNLRKSGLFDCGGSLWQEDSAERSLSVNGANSESDFPMADTSSHTLQRSSENERKVGNRPSNLVQISVPEIDCLLETKQTLASGAKLCSIPLEYTKDVLSQKLAEVYDIMDNDPDRWCGEDSQTQETEKGEILVRDKFMRVMGPVKMLSADVARFVVLQKIADHLLDEPEDPRLHDIVRLYESTIELCASKLGRIYSQAVYSMGVKENMTEREVQIFVDAYDDYVYNKKPMSSLITKVFSSGILDMKDSFTSLFFIIKRIGWALTLRRPKGRWSTALRGRIKSQEVVVQKKEKLNEAPPMDETLVRIIQGLETVDKRIEIFLSAIDSAKTQLDTVHVKDFKGRTGLENRLKEAMDMYEKALREKRQLEKEYEEYQEMRLKEQVDSLTKTTSRRGSSKGALSALEVMGS